MIWLLLAGGVGVLGAGGVFSVARLVPWSVEEKLARHFGGLPGAETYDGLVQQAESAEELAGVLAHEIEHVQKRHIIQGVFARLLTIESLRFIFTGPTGTSSATELAGVLLNLRYGRSQESQADLGGLERLDTARVNPAGYRHFFDRMASLSEVPAFLSDHPSNQQRSDLASQHAARVDSVPILTASEWARLKKSCHP